MMDILFSTSKSLREMVQNYLIVSLAATLAVWYIQYLWKRRYLYIHSWKVAGPLSFPIIGCTYLFSGNGTDIMHKIIKIQQDISAGILRMWIGPKLFYIISKPEYVEKVLNHPKAMEKDDVYKFMADGIGFGLLTAPANKWKRHRKVLAPSFNQRILDSFVEVFAENSIVFAKELENVVGEKNLDLYQFASRYTLDVICQTAMGVNMNIQREKGRFGTVIEKLLELLTYRLFRIWYHPNLIWHSSPLKVKFEEYKKEFHNVTGSVVTMKLAEQTEKLKLRQQGFEADIEEEPSCKRLAFLDLILKNSEFTETELREEVDIFLAAGTETTASSVSCLFTMLGMYPEIQQKVYEEVIDIFGPDRIVEASDLPRMKYTEKVIKENLRLFPIGAAFARAVVEDIDLGDVILPAGSSAAICPIYIHRSPEYWKDPLKFDPDRFSSEEVAKRHPCTYIPFSYGPRNCIGWKYAIANIKVIIATVIRRYKIFTEYKSVEEIKLKINILLSMAEGSKVWLEYR